MNEAEKKLIIDSYNQRLSHFGHSPDTLGWHKRRHYLRYHILLSHWWLEDQQILDFGCGFGDMYDFIRKNNIQTHYHGIDMNPKLIQAGLQAYPQAKLICADPLREGLPRKYDYIFSSGVHNFKLQDNWAYIEKTFELFCQHSQKGFAINFMSDKVDFRQEDLYYSNPGRVLELAYRFSRRVVLRNDYMPFEYTVFVDQQICFNPDCGVYPEFERWIVSTES